MFLSYRISLALQPANGRGRVIPRYFSREFPMTLRCTILCENSVPSQFGLIGEHGFACMVETPQGNYLFDTGQGQGLLNNARILQKDLRNLRAIVLSHGHYDHTGGLPDALHQTGPIDVFGHPALFEERYRATGKLQRFIGIPHRRSYLETLGARFRLGSAWREIGAGVYLSGEIPRQTAYERGDAKMTLVTADGARISPDPLADDLSLVIDAPGGLVVVLGCAHAGLINILLSVCHQLKRSRIHTVLGGTHLDFADDAQFAQTLAALDDFQIQCLAVSHCTGLGRAAQLQARFGERFRFGTVGTTLEI